MNVTITGVFTDYTAAQTASTGLSVLQNNKDTMSVTMEEYNPESLTGLRNLLGRNTPTQLLDVTPLGEYTGHVSTSMVVRICCKDIMSSFVTRELAEFGAKKITITPMS